MGSVLTRWCRSLEAFGRAFTADVGAEPRSYMLELAPFTVKEARFRKEMERLRNTARRDVTIEVSSTSMLLLFGFYDRLSCSPFGDIW